MKIKELFLDERPRERLLKNGAEILSNVELLAILLRTGTREKNAVDLARELLGNGKTVAYDEIMDAVSDFDMVNAKLAAILEKLKVEEF